ncbi:hypothetical protein [Trinickia mobilis]|uniref:hypothetical protein n=1 Tax=Trinickia mobilis TaxID=2816356 RepID=UPI001A8C9FD6|nr:hypothetical protein [Trinickia mobilis]
MRDALVPLPIVSDLKLRPDLDYAQNPAYPHNPCTELWITSGAICQLIGAKATFRLASRDTTIAIQAGALEQVA